VTTSHRELVSRVMHVSHLLTNHNLADPRSNWTGLSQAARDAAYDNNAAVKNRARSDCRAERCVREIASEPQIVPARTPRRGQGSQAIAPLPVDGADHLTILSELRSSDGALVNSARKLVA